MTVQPLPQLDGGKAFSSPRTETMSPAAVVFDLSRLISRARHATPTGIDRVDLAYARALLAEPRRAIGFAADLPGLGRRHFNRAAVDRFVAATAARWEQARGGGNPALALLSCMTRTTLPGDSIDLVVAHQRLDRPHRLQQQLRGSRHRLVAFIHDAIPCEYPEYARADSVERHRTRLVTAAHNAHGLIVNSHATAAAIAPYRRDRQPLLVAPLGVAALRESPPAHRLACAANRPYFLCIGTIEPRKNHLLLLNLWRRFAETLPAGDVPRLVLVGRRGWENENIIDMLDRCTAIDGIVEEHNSVSDARLAVLIGGARAVLMPSFAEGFGLPVAEALVAGTPVIASDLPALRETGGAVPDYLDPLDGPAWRAAITDYARPDSARRQQQLNRLVHWTAPSWDAHFASVFLFLDGLRQ
jgi:glycosyltransferase involved in cell wall biosynthesis